jgi:hypothetical protein
MSNVKAQMPNQIQSSNYKILKFDIHLTFACLPQAGILTFGIKNSG